MTSTAPKVRLHAPALPDDRRLKWLEIAPLLDRCSQHLRTVLRDSAKASGLNERHAMILWLCAADPTGSAQIELAEQLALSPPQLSLLLEQLRERGLIDSIRDPRDRRRQRSLLTQTGHQAWHAVAGELNRKLQRFDETIESEQFEQLSELLHSLAAAAATGPRLQVIAASESESAIQETEI